jgi:hypothetical protein
LKIKVYRYFGARANFIASLASIPPSLIFEVYPGLWLRRTP